MKFTFLGTGTSQGVPIIGCDCAVCVSDNIKDNRLRSSLLIESATTTIVIDTGPDFRQQMLREQIKSLDAVVFTHSHKDHLAGMDDIRAFNYLQQKPMDMYATEFTWAVVKNEFPYVFAANKYPGVPSVNEFVISEKEAFTIGDITLQPILVWHYKMPVLGFRINDFVYITDANRIDQAEMNKAKGATHFVLNALRHEEHISHFTLAQAIEQAQIINADYSYFTHISHLLGKHDAINKILPPNISLAYDGLKIEI
jgi:phosphoribosyl 1,2-cyclic phosphate phosphodiesterase